MRKLARLGEQSGVVAKALRNSAPSRAMRSMFGVLTNGCPMQPRSSQRRSSIRMNTMFGRGGVSGSAPAQSAERPQEKPHEAQPGKSLHQSRPSERDRSALDRPDSPDIRRAGAVCQVAGLRSTARRGRRREAGPSPSSRRSLADGVVEVPPGGRVVVQRVAIPIARLVGLSREIGRRGAWIAVVVGGYE